MRTTLQTTHGHDRTTSDIEFLTALRIGINGHLWGTRADGVDQTTLDVTVAIGIETVVILTLCIDIPSTDGHVALRVNGIVVGVGSHFTACYHHFTLGLDTFTVLSTGSYPDGATSDGQIAIHLDTLWRRGVVVAIILSPLGDDVYLTTIEVGLQIHIDPLPARASALQQQLTAIHRQG